MRAGGKIVDDQWLVRVSALRVGDVIECQNWNPERGHWWGGYPIVVDMESETTGLRDGYHYLPYHYRDHTDEWNIKVIRPTDLVTIVSRDVVEAVPVEEQPRVEEDNGQRRLLF